MRNTQLFHDSLWIPIQCSRDYAVHSPSCTIGSMFTIILSIFQLTQSEFGASLNKWKKIPNILDCVWPLISTTQSCFHLRKGGKYIFLMQYIKHFFSMEYICNSSMIVNGSQFSVPEIMRYFLQAAQFVQCSQLFLTDQPVSLGQD